MVATFLLCAEIFTAIFQSNMYCMGLITIWGHSIDSYLVISWITQEMTFPGHAMAMPDL
jgi:hypothetical protein